MTRCIICNDIFYSSYNVKYVCLGCREKFTEIKQPKILNKVESTKHERRVERLKKRKKSVIRTCLVCGNIIDGRKKYCDFCRVIKKNESYNRTRIRTKQNNKTLECNYKKYILSAEKRKIKFDLSIDEFGTMWQKDCYYCGSKIKTIGVDRINSKQGYTVSNTVPCCTTCNMMKYTHSVDTFMNHIKKIHKFNNLTNK